MMSGVSSPFVFRDFVRHLGPRHLARFEKQQSRVEGILRSLDLKLEEKRQALENCWRLGGPLS